MRTFLGFAEERIEVASLAAERSLLAFIALNLPTNGS
jgi:hypothetical protein